MSKYNSAICSFENLKIGNCSIGISGLGKEGEDRAIGIFDCIFKNIFLFTCSFAGFCLSGSGNVIIEPRVTYSNTAFMFYHVSDESFDGCTVIGGVIVSSTGYDITFRMSGIRPIIFIGTWFEQSNYGICNVVAVSSKVMNITFIGCMFNSNSTQYDLFTMSNVAYGIIEIFNCTFYATLAGANTNVKLPTTSTTVKGIVRDCIKITSAGACSLYSVNDN